jgi:hypothetical protein
VTGWVFVDAPWIGFTVDLGGLSLDVEGHDGKWLARICRPEEVLHETDAVFPAWEAAATEAVRLVRAVLSRA